MSSAQEWDFPQPRRPKRRPSVEQIDDEPRRSRYAPSQTPPRRFSIKPFRAAGLVARGIIGGILGFGMAITLWFLVQIVRF
jgi:hypothetical protein